MPVPLRPRREAKEKMGRGTDLNDVGATQMPFEDLLLLCWTRFNACDATPTLSSNNSFSSATRATRKPCSPIYNDATMIHCARTILISRLCAFLSRGFHLDETQKQTRQLGTFGDRRGGHITRRILCLTRLVGIEMTGIMRFSNA